MGICSAFFFFFPTDCGVSLIKAEGNKNQTKKDRGASVSAQFCLCVVHWGEIFHLMHHSQFAERILKVWAYLLGVLWICFK